MPNHAKHHDDAPTAPIPLPALAATRRPRRRAALFVASAIGLSLASGTAGAAAYALTQAPSTPAVVAVQAAPAVAPQPIAAPATTPTSTSPTTSRRTSTVSEDETESTTERTTSAAKPSRSTSSESEPSAAECEQIRDHYLYDSALSNASIAPQLRSQGCDDAADSLLTGSFDG